MLNFIYVRLSDKRLEELINLSPMFATRIIPLKKVGVNLPSNWRKGVINDKMYLQYTDEDDKKRILTQKSLSRGIEICNKILEGESNDKRDIVIKKYGVHPSYIKEAIFGEVDSECSEYFIQLCLYGKVIYS